MCCNFPTIKITEGNAFTLIFPLKRRSYVAERPIDEDIDVTRLTDVRVTLGGVEYAPTIETYGVRIDVPATLSRGTYDGLLTADYDGNAIRGAYESCVQVVAWNAQSNAQQYILGSPVATKAAYVLGYMPTDAEVEELKQQLREQIAAAEQAEAEAIAEKERYAEAIEHLDDIAKQGDDPEVSLTSLSEIIEGLDISKVAKQGTDRTATNTAIRDKVDEIIATIGGEADVNAVYLGLINRQTDYQAEGFPDQQDLPHLPQAVAAFTPRKISNGGAENDGIPDGISIAQLLCSTSAASSVTEIVDDNTGWTMTRNQLGLFPNAKNVSLSCEVIDVTPTEHTNFISSSVYESISFKGTKKVYVRKMAGCVSVPNGIVDFSDLEEFYGWMSHYRYALVSACANEKVDLSKLHKVERTGSTVGFICVPIIANSPNLKDIDLSAMSYFYTGQQSSYYNRCYHFRDCPNVECIKVGKLTSFNSINFMAYSSNSDNTYIVFQRLVKFEIGAGTAISLNLAYWDPSVALDASRTDLIEEGSTASNNLQQFLLNFRDYIALRLADRTGSTALTLTLSAAVYSALTSDTRSLADLGITADDLTAAETAAGITTATAYNSWLDTYRAAINWNYAQA